jgi:heme exporter protein D
MTPLATSIPGSSNNGYVAAAYIVFFAIVLIYVAIMALRLTRVERSLRELNEREQRAQREARQDGSQQGGAPTPPREHETV